MLNSDNIKNILYKSKEITEVKYMDKTVWASFDDMIGAPGNRTLLAGNMQAGWFGEVPSSSFITGDELALKVGISSGTSQYSSEPWLKFAYEGSVLLIAKKPIRYFISWEIINDANCVYGDKTVEIKTKKYKVMLMRGIGEDVQPNPKTLYRASNGVACQNSMWNKLMLPIHQNAPSNWSNKDNVKTPTENWNVGYTDADLIVNYNSGDGYCTICQEMVEYNNYYSTRGGNSISDASRVREGLRSKSYGWRPCLQLIG